MPCKCRQVFGFGAVNRSVSLLGHNLVGLVVDGDVDVADVKVDGRNQLDACNPGNGLENLGTVPGVKDERSESYVVLANLFSTAPRIDPQVTYLGPNPRIMFLAKSEEYWQLSRTGWLKSSARICLMASGVKSWKGAEAAVGEIPCPSRPISFIV